MEQEFYGLTSAYIIIMDLILSFLLLQTLRVFGASRKLVTTTFFLLSGWLGILIFGISGKNLFPQDLSEMSFFIILISGVGAIATGTFLSPLKKALIQIPHEFLLLPQGLRVFFGGGFLIEAILGIMPPAFAILDGGTHISAAFLALIVAILYKSQWSSQRSLWIANLFGLLDIGVVAIGISFYLLEIITPHHNLMYAAFFAAPIFITLHLVGLYKLSTE